MISNCYQNSKTEFLKIAKIWWNIQTFRTLLFHWPPTINQRVRPKSCNRPEAKERTTWQDHCVNVHQTINNWSCSEDHTDINLHSIFAAIAQTTDVGYLSTPAVDDQSSLERYRIFYAVMLSLHMRELLKSKFHSLLFVVESLWAIEHVVQKKLYSKFTKQTATSWHTTIKMLYRRRCTACGTTIRSQQVYYQSKKRSLSLIVICYCADISLHVLWRIMTEVSINIIVHSCCIIYDIPLCQSHANRSDRYTSTY